MRKITQVEILENYQLDLTFDDGVTGAVDLSDLAGRGVFAAWDDRDLFHNVRIGSSGELAWGESIDLCPDSLYLRVTGKKPEDMFPTLRNQPTRA